MQPLQQDRDNQAELVPALTAALAASAQPEPVVEAPDDQLADLLDASLSAERGAPGASVAIVQTAPERLRFELEELLALGHALRRRLAGQPSPSRLSALRQRIMARIEPTPPG
ncbi:MAG: hypothetical protein ACR2IK_18815 [Chloroflexota bacterium]